MQASEQMAELFLVNIGTMRVQVYGREWHWNREVYGILPLKRTLFP